LKKRVEAGNITAGGGICCLGWYQSSTGFKL